MTGDYPKPPQPPRRVKYFTPGRAKNCWPAARVVRSSHAFLPLSPQVSPTSSFSADLGLDSLDTVEVVMAMEEEFAVEIPDADADKITSVSEAVEYLANNANAK